MKGLVAAVIFTLGLLGASAAHADWHAGKIQRIQIAYDGSTITFAVAGHVRSNCTCYANWPDSMCLNRNHASFKEEVALLYMTRTRGGTFNYNIDEATCSVLAMYETD